jgi:hypothetical protein
MNKSRIILVLVIAVLIIDLIIGLWFVRHICCGVK